MSRKPCIYFDGRQLVVFSRDHISYLILIYKVRLSGEDDPSISPTGHIPGTQADGNVYNFTSTAYVQFASRIRHHALAGLSRWDSLQMTCNERFLVFNTRRSTTSEESGGKEGLIVIDLKVAAERLA